MTADEETDADVDPTTDLDAREAERVRRRDRDAAAVERELMKPGMGKVFKQIQDAQRKTADRLARDRPTGPGSRPKPRRA